jgi:hypothetical protein
MNQMNAHYFGYLFAFQRNPLGIEERLKADRTVVGGFTGRVLGPPTVTYIIGIVRSSSCFRHRYTFASPIYLAAELSTARAGMKWPLHEQHIIFPGLQRTM